MRPVNLIPPEQRRGDRAAVRTGMVPYLLVGLVAVAVVAVSLVTLVGKQVDDRKTQLANLQAEEEATRADAEALAPYAQFASLSLARTATVSSLAQSRFDWERVMRELSRVMPSDVWLTNLTGAATGGDDEVTSGITGPSLSLTGCADGHEAVARFLATLEDIDGVTRVGVSRSELGDVDPANSGASGSTTAGSTDCRVRNFISQFDIVVAFDDAVPAIPSEATPADPAATAEAAVASAATPEQQQATDSAAKQTGKAKKAANLIPGVE